MNPSCYVIGATEWHELMTAIAWMPVIVAGMVWMICLDWYRVELWVRRFFRRRRLRTIRASRLGGAA